MSEVSFIKRQRLNAIIPTQERFLMNSKYRFDDCILDSKVKQPPDLKYYSRTSVQVSRPISSLSAGQSFRSSMVMFSKEDSDVVSALGDSLPDPHVHMRYMSGSCDMSESQTDNTGRSQL